MATTEAFNTSYAENQREIEIGDIPDHPESSGGNNQPAISSTLELDLRRATGNNVGEIRSIWFYHVGGLLNLLMSGENFDATDPRDKVYSVLGLGRTPTEAAIELDQTTPSPTLQLAYKEGMLIDYSKPVSEVYQYLAKYIINRDRNLDILCVACIHRDSKSDDLPTWTPDWRVRNPNIGFEKDYFRLKYNATGFTKAKMQSQEALGTLTVQGYMFDFIAEIMDTTTDAASMLNAWFNQRENKYMHPFNATRHPSRCCTTQRGRLILVPAATKEEGGIYGLFVLLGSKVPFVMKAVSNQQFYATEDGKPYFNDLKWELVGPCCAPDLMYGYAARAMEDKPEEIDLLDITLM